MNETIIGIFGVILTLIFGVYSIWIYKKTNKKVSLGIEKKEGYSLFKKDVNRLNIDIKYGNKTIDNHLILFKGEILNNGKTDIDKSRIFQPIKIKCSEKFKWLETNVSETPKDSTVSLTQINDTTLELGWDLLKSKEKIEFESLIEIPNDIINEDISEDFYDSLNFDFRITDLNKIEKLTETYPRKKRRSRFKKIAFVMGLFTFVAGLLIFFSPELPENLSLIKKKKDLEYVLQKDGKIFTNDIIAYSDETLIINGEKISVNDFNNTYQIKELKILSDNSSSLYNRIMGLIYIITGFFFFFKIYRKKTTHNTV